MTRADDLKLLNEAVESIRKLYGGKIGNYDLIEGLDVTPFSFVYLCRSQEDKHVAIKEPREIDNKDSYERMGNLHRAIGNSHPNICGYRENIEDKIVLEYYHARTLKDVRTQRNDNRIPFDIAVEVYSQVLNALCFAAERGIFHGDVAERNILYPESGCLLADGQDDLQPEDSGLIKVIDFGIAEMIEKGLPAVERNSYYEITSNGGAGFDHKISPLALTEHILDLDDQRHADYATCFQLAHSFYNSVEGATLIPSPRWKFGNVESSYPQETIAEFRRIMNKAIISHNKEDLEDIESLEPSESAYFSLREFQKDFERARSALNKDKQRFMELYDRTIEAMDYGIQNGMSLESVLKDAGTARINTNIKNIFEEYTQLMGYQNQNPRRFEELKNKIIDDILHSSFNLLVDLVENLEPKKENKTLTREETELTSEITQKYFAACRQYAPKDIIEEGQNIKGEYRKADGSVEEIHLFTPAKRK